MLRRTRSTNCCGCLEGASVVPQTAAAASKVVSLCFGFPVLSFHLGSILCFRIVLFRLSHLRGHGSPFSFVNFNYFSFFLCRVRFSLSTNLVSSTMACHYIMFSAYCVTMNYICVVVLCDHVYYVYVVLFCCLCHIPEPSVL